VARRSYTPERIVNKLREAEVLRSQGSTVGEAARKIGVTDETYYRWRREYGGMRINEVEQARNLSRIDLLFQYNTDNHASMKNSQIISMASFKTLVHLGGRCSIRTFFEEDIEIPIYAIPLLQKIRAR